MDMRICVFCGSSFGNNEVYGNAAREMGRTLAAHKIGLIYGGGRVGLMGVSYLAMSQRRVAALKPPHLRAIVPWEGVTDLYREFAFHGGIPEGKFIPIWFKIRIKRGRNRRLPLAEDFLIERERHPLDDAYWLLKRPILEDIEVPALVCANWSDHGLHTRGSIEGFERISSREKWLFTHGRKKWETF